jgi:hypothetical protein
LLQLPQPRPFLPLKLPRLLLRGSSCGHSFLVLTMSPPPLTPRRRCWRSVAAVAAAASVVGARVRHSY